MPFYKNNNDSTQKNKWKQPDIRTFHSLNEVIQAFKVHFANQEGIVYRKITIDNKDKNEALLIFIQNITNQANISDQIIQPLKSMKDQEIKTSLMTYIKNSIITAGNITATSNFTILFDKLLSGDALLFIEKEQQALAISVKEWKGRQIEEPDSQTVVRGPRESFTENININKSLIRKRIKSNKLQFHSIMLGEYNQTAVSIVYIQDIAEESIISEVKERLEKIQIDGVLESNTIEEHIQDEPFTLFPTVENTERSDIASAALLEGRVLIMLDGTPFTLIVPVVFIQFFQTAEDYYSRATTASAIRILRFLSLFITLFAPSIYIALTTYHQEMIPTLLLSSLAAQREGVPFPAFVEAVMMEITFEILREAGIRMPKMIGQAVSVVGAIVIGSAAVEAGLVSAAMVIVVSITAIASFVIPSYNMANSIRLLRFLMMFLAGSFGFLGIMVGLFAIIIHLSSLRSFGIAYMAPLSPFYIRDQKDAFIRLIRTSFSSKEQYLKDKKE